MFNTEILSVKTANELRALAQENNMPKFQKANKAAMIEFLLGLNATENVVIENLENVENAEIAEVPQIAAIPEVAENAQTETQAARKERVKKFLFETCPLTVGSVFSYSGKWANEIKSEILSINEKNIAICMQLTGKGAGKKFRIDLNNEGNKNVILHTKEEPKKD